MDPLLDAVDADFGVVFAAVGGRLRGEVEDGQPLPAGDALAGGDHGGAEQRFAGGITSAGRRVSSEAGNTYLMFVCCL